MGKTVIGIRTNTWTLMEQQLYLKLLQYFSAENIFVIVDECNKTASSPVFPLFLNKISWDKDFIKEESLLNYNHFNRGIGWLCGDYFYYAFSKYVKADYYWLIEPDVLFSFENVGDFFSSFEALSDDGLLANIKPLSETDYWQKSSQIINQKEQFGCLFALSRLSWNAVEICKQERQKFSQLYKDNQAYSFNNNPLTIHFPNDESLVINTLKKEGLSVRNFKDILPKSFNFFSYHQWFSMPQQDVLPVKEQVIHPARSIQRIKDDIAQNILKDINKYLDYHVITEDNISLLSSQIGKEVADHCLSYLSDKKTIHRLFVLAIEFLNDNFVAGFRLDKHWIYNNEIVVSDFYYNDIKITFDIYTNQNDEICCDIFQRNNPDSKWINELSTFLKEGIKSDGKVTLFMETSVENLKYRMQEMIKELDNYINQH